jgi:hypothetical protein
VVAAPSKLQRPSGDQVKTDARDGRHIPSVEQQAARDLVRAREDSRGLDVGQASSLEIASAAGDRLLRREGVDWQA